MALHAAKSANNSQKCGLKPRAEKSLSIESDKLGWDAVMSYAKLPPHVVSCLFLPLPQAAGCDSCRNRHERRAGNRSEVTEHGDVNYVSARLFDHGILVRLAASQRPA